MAEAHVEAVDAQHRRPPAPESVGTASKSARVYGSTGASTTSAVDPASTTRPACMTGSRSVFSATTARSWLISNSPSPSDRRTSRTISSTSAWTVTSSALVGSSARSSSDLSATCDRDRDALRVRRRRAHAGSGAARAGRDRLLQRATSGLRALLGATRTPCSAQDAGEEVADPGDGAERRRRGFGRSSRSGGPRTSRSCRAGPTSSTPSSGSMPSTLAPAASASPSVASAVSDLPEPTLSDEADDLGLVRSRGAGARRRAPAEREAQIADEQLHAAAPLCADRSGRAGRRRAG